MALFLTAIIIALAVLIVIVYYFFKPLEKNETIKGKSLMSI